MTSPLIECVRRAAFWDLRTCLECGETVEDSDICPTCGSEHLVDSGSLAGLLAKVARECEEY